MAVALEVIITPHMTIAGAACELVGAASATGMCCRAQFNGMWLIVVPDTDPVDLVRAFFAARETGDPVAKSGASLRERLLREADAVMHALLPVAAPSAGNA
jgi:hypothetical protein